MDKPPRRKLEHSIHLLPPMLQDIAQIVGVEKSVEIGRRLGGKRFYFADRMRASNPLVQIVGFRDARRLSREFSKLNERIPSARSYLRWFDARVAVLLGFEIGEIARLIGANYRHTRELLDGFDADQWYVDEVTGRRFRCPCCGSRPRVAPTHVPAPACQVTMRTLQLDFGFPAR